MGRNKTIRCLICNVFMRSDHLLRHMEKHKTTKKCGFCKKILLAKNMQRHLQLHSVTAEEIKNNVLIDKEEYEKLKFTSGVLRSVLVEENIHPQILRGEYRKALEIPIVASNNDIKMKSWQDELFKRIEPSNREIIWVYGRYGGEGKSWLQDLMEQKFTPKQVFRTSMDKRKESILHSLSKRCLSVVDMFLFNIPRSFAENDIPYTLFEDIKDGYSISTKYDSKQLRFITPNVLVVFANYRPEKSKVSYDRWCIYEIINEKLEGRY